MSANPISHLSESSDIATIAILFGENAKLQQLFPEFLSSTTTSAEMQQVVQEMTKEVVETAKDLAIPRTISTVALIPILRGALPMYVAAQSLFTKPESILVRGYRANHSEPVRLDWLGRAPSTADLTERHILIMDTVIATGGTILKICDELMSLGGDSKRGRCITILACYVSPIGLTAVAKHPLVRAVIAAVKADGVDEHGYTIPYPGDVGDKLFGKKQGNQD